MRVTTQYNAVSKAEDFILFLLLLFYIIGQNDHIFIIGSCLTLFLSYKLYINKGVHISFVDICIIALWIFSVFNYFLSANHISSIFYFKDFTLCVLLYFLLRSELNNWHEKKRILLFISFIIGIMSIISIISFIMFSEQIYNLDFDSTYDFRFKYRPLGILLNIWSSLQLCFLGIIVLSIFHYRKNIVILIFLYCTFVINMFIIITSFTRGIYLAYTFILISSFVLVLKTKIELYKKGLLLGLIVIPLMLFVCIYKEEISKTIKFKETISQQRSISGRIDAMSSSQGIIKNYPLFGIGANNFSYAIEKYLYENDNNTFTSFAPNGYTQLLTEQGFIGFLLWFFLIISILYQCIYYRKRLTVQHIIIASILISLLIREISFPAFLNNSIIMLMCFMYFAIFQNNLNCNKFYFKKYKPVIYVISLICIFFIGISVKHFQNIKNNNLAIQHMSEKNIYHAIKYINKTDGSVPYLFNRSIIYNTLFEQTGDKAFLKEAKYNIHKAIQKSDNDNMLEYQLSRLLMKENKIDSAKIIIGKLITDYPNSALYNISYFEILYNYFDKDEALKYLIKAIELSPNILKSKLIEVIQKDDYNYMYKMNNLLYERIKEESLDNLNDPICLAKRGKILLFLCKYHMSALYLKKAIDILPNLIMPWYHLGEIEEMNGNTDKSNEYYLRYLTLTSPNNKKLENMKKYILSGEIHKNIEVKSLLYKYENKFTNWYKTKSAIIYITTNY